MMSLPPRWLMNAKITHWHQDCSAHWKGCVDVEMSSLAKWGCPRHNLETCKQHALIDRCSAHLGSPGKGMRPDDWNGAE